MGFFIGQFNNFFEFFTRGKFKQFLPSKDYDHVQSIINGCLTLGAFICTLTGAIPLKYIPYRFLMIACMFIMILTNLLQIWSPLIGIYVLRVIIGYTMCFYTFIGPITVSQCLPSRFVGPLRSFVYVVSTCRMLVAFTISSDISEKYWEVFLSIPIFIEIIRFILYISFFYIESPYFIYNSLLKSSKNKMNNSEINIKRAFMEDKHVNKLVRIFFKKEDHTLQKRFLYDQIDEFFSNKTEGKGIIWTACSKRYRIPFIIAFMLNPGNRLTGVMFIVMYSKQIFETLKLSNIGVLVLMGGKLYLNTRIYLFLLLAFLRHFW